MVRRLPVLTVAGSIALVALTAGPAEGQPPFENRVADGNLVGANVTNHGVVGNNFVSRSPSLEYPLGSGYEHLTRAGWWIGARAIDAEGAFTGVATGILDQSQGIVTSSLTEFTPASGILRRSNLPASPDYSPNAVSENDLIASFDDHVVRRPINSVEDSRPMGLLVRQECYAWTGGDLAHALFFHLVLTNTGPPLEDVWVGLSTEFASGPKLSYSCWPPASACGGGLGSWFRKKWLEYDAGQRLLREHYCRNFPAPSNCQLATVPYWAGLVLLTPPAGAQRLTLAAWEYGPGAPERDQDVERYAILSAGTIADVAAFLPGLSDPEELMALGPFPFLAPGDSAVVDFALVGGADVSEIRAHAASAQELYDRGYVLPTPTQLALIESRAESDRVTLAWHSTDPAAAAARVQRREAGTDWRDAGVVEAAGDRLSFVDRGVEPGRRYGYRLALAGPAGDTFHGETWVDVPLGASFALHGLRPNPARGGDLVASFSLARPGAVTLTLYDLAGRRVLARALDGLAAGNHTENLGPGAALAPGAYLLAIEQSGRRVTKRVLVLE